jgi:hypothetical protein
MSHLLDEAIAAKRRQAQTEADVIREAIMQAGTYQMGATVYVEGLGSARADLEVRADGTWAVKPRAT